MMNGHFQFLKFLKKKGYVMILEYPEASKLHQVERLHQSKVLTVKSFEMHVRSSKDNPEAYIDRIL